MNKTLHKFAVLRALDANADGVIDASDPVFAQLRVWVDASADGRSGAGELLTLEAAGVRSIDLSYTNSSHVDAQGNAHRRVGSYTTSEGEVRSATDVWVRTNPTQSLHWVWARSPTVSRGIRRTDESRYPTCFKATSRRIGWRGQIQPQRKTFAKAKA